MVMDLEECCHGFRVTFTKDQANVQDGVYQCINGNRKIFPLNQEVELTESEWLNFKQINKVRKLLPEYEYNPFAD